MCVFSPKSLVAPFSFGLSMVCPIYLMNSCVYTYLLLVLCKPICRHAYITDHSYPYKFLWVLRTSHCYVPDYQLFMASQSIGSGCRMCCTCTPTGLLLLRSSQMHRWWHGANRNMVAIHPMFKMSSGFCSREFSMLQIVKDCLFELCSLIWLRLTENMWVKSIALYISLIYYLGSGSLPKHAGKTTTCSVSSQISPTELRKLNALCLFLLQGCFFKGGK